MTPGVRITERDHNEMRDQGTALRSLLLNVLKAYLRRMLNRNNENELMDKNLLLALQDFCLLKIFFIKDDFDGSLTFIALYFKCFARVALHNIHFRINMQFFNQVH